MVVPTQFPKELPIVHELGGRIPRQGRYHINPDDFSLCLGSRLRLLITLAHEPTLIGFAKNCLIPYLYAVSHKLAQGGEFAFGELPHGSTGELADYGDLLGLHTTNQVMKAIRYLGMKKRRANKLPCACGCGQRLGACAFNERIRKLRRVAERAWFRQLLSELSRTYGSSGLSSSFQSAVRTALGVTAAGSA